MGEFRVKSTGLTRHEESTTHQCHHDDARKNEEATLVVDMKDWLPKPNSRLSKANEGRVQAAKVRDWPGPARWSTVFDSVNDKLFSRGGQQG